MNHTIKKILLKTIPYLELYYGYLCTKLPKCSYFKFVRNNLRARRGNIYWPVEDNCQVICPEKIFVGRNANIGRINSYLQGTGTIYVGDYTQFGPGVGVMSSNHDLYVQYKHHEKPIVIGDYCWLGRNVNILAGVTLGPRTIVGAGAVVTKSFPEGFCVLGGNPAKVIKYLEKDKFTPWHYSEEYYGYLTKAQFEKYKKKYLKFVPEIENT